MPIKLNKTQKTVQNKYARNHYTITNNPPHTTHTHRKNPSRLAVRATTTTRAADAHTVLNVNPTVCSSAENFYAQPKNAPTPTTHDRAVNTCRHKKTTNTTQQAMLLVPHKLGSLERR